MGRVVPGAGRCMAVCADPDIRNRGGPVVEQGPQTGQDQAVEGLLTGIVNGAAGGATDFQGRLTTVNNP